MELALAKTIWAIDSYPVKPSSQLEKMWGIQESGRGNFVLCDIASCPERSIKHLYVLAPPPIEEVITTPLEPELIKPRINTKEFKKKKPKKRSAVKWRCTLVRIKRK